MEYVTQIERRGIEKGRQEGRQEAVREVLLSVLEARFGDIPCELREEIMRLADADQLGRLARHAAQAPYLAAFRAHIG